MGRNEPDRLDRVRHRDRITIIIEGNIMSALDDATTRITNKVDQLIAAVKAGQGGGTTDDADVAALNAASDRADAALSPPPGSSTSTPDAGTTSAGTDANPDNVSTNPPG